MSVRVGAAFNFESLLTSLMDWDDRTIGKIDVRLSDYSQLSTAINANQLADEFPLRRLPPETLTDIQAPLFHERIHYWQLLSTSFAQFQFIAFLDLMRLRLREMGLNDKWVCGQQFDDSDSSLIEEYYISACSNFESPGVTEQMIQTPNHVLVSPPTAMPFVLLPRLGSKQSTPGYAARLGFGSDHKEVLVPFAYINLIEAAAQLSEHLFLGKPISRPDHLDKEQDQIYLGLWEFFCRMHGSRFDSDTEAALALLAMLDLGMSSDAIEPQLHSLEDKYEIGSVSYRFGKLIFRAQGFPKPWVAKGSDYAHVVASYQNAFCDYVGWSSPASSAQKMAVFLTQLLFLAVSRHMDNAKRKAMTARLFGQSATAIAENFSQLHEGWELINEANAKGPPRIGQHIVGLMLNATICRLQNPGWFALPHLYHQQLQQRFPLPIVVSRGVYYFDADPGTSVGQGYPYHVSALEASHDCISLMTTKPIRDRSKRCGFEQNLMDCHHTAQGWGCPQRGLSPEQQAKRQDSGLDDWCHWTLRALLLGNASPATQQRWVN